MGFGEPIDPSSRVAELLAILHPLNLIGNSIDFLKKLPHLVLGCRLLVLRAQELMLLGRLIEIVVTNVPQRDALAVGRAQVEIVDDLIKPAARVAAQLVLDADVVAERAVDGRAMLLCHLYEMAY